VDLQTCHLRIERQGAQRSLCSFSDPLSGRTRATC
jgi:hypothetical protein